MSVSFLSGLYCHFSVVKNVCPNVLVHLVDIGAERALGNQPFKQLGRTAVGVAAIAAQK